MIHVRVTLEFEADSLGPHEILTHSFVVSPCFAKDAEDAQAKLLTLMATQEYFEVPEEGPLGIVLLDTTTIEVPPVAVPLPMLDPEPSVVPGVGAS